MNASKNRNENGELLTVPQVAEKSNLGIAAVNRLARESGSMIRIGRSVRINWAKFYEYLLDTYSVSV